MQAVHELGHVLHAWLSGGTVTRVVLHPPAISRTDVRPNPHAEFVAWGGFVWGSLLPLALWALLGLRRLGKAAGGGPWVFAGLFAAFCIVANGAYLATALLSPVGDTRDLLRQGEPAWLLFLPGLTAIAAGLYAAHRVEISIEGKRLQANLAPRHVAGVTIALAVVIILECLLSARR